MDLIKATHDAGEDKKIKTTYKILGQTLYQRGLPEEQQSIVDEAHSKGRIHFHRKDDPVQAVFEIVKVVVIDPPIAVFTRLISSFNKIESIKRRSNEDLSSFASRFRDAAAEHLQHTYATSSFQVGQVFAITLLNNANMDENMLKIPNYSSLTLLNNVKQMELKSMHVKSICLQSKR